MYRYKLNNSYTTYVNYEYINECIKAGKKWTSSNKKSCKRYKILSIKDTVKIGSKVCVRNLDTQEDETFILSYSNNIFKSDIYISPKSPVGNALLGHKAGDNITIKVPAGILRYKIISFEK